MFEFGVLVCVGVCVVFLFVVVLVVGVCVAVLV